MMLRDEILSLLKYKNDRGFWYDVNKDWLETKADLINRSTDKDDKEKIMQDDLYKIATELIQIASLEEFCKQMMRRNQEYPNLHIPYFMKQSLGATFTDLYNINSQKALCKLMKRIRT